MPKSWADKLEVEIQDEVANNVDQDNTKDVCIDCRRAAVPQGDHSVWSFGPLMETNCFIGQLLLGRHQVGLQKGLLPSLIFHASC